MGARPSQYRKSGGFLNNVDGTIVGYRFTDEFNGESFTPGRDPKTKKEKFHSLFFIPEIQVDGADDPVTITLFAGGYDDWEVSEDEKTIIGVGETEETPQEERKQLGAGTALAKFISSLCEAGFPESNLPENDINFECIIGTRCRFVQRKDEEATKKYGKRKAKNGKEYDRQDLMVDQVYDLPEVEAKTNGKAKAPVKAAAKTTAPAKKTAGKAKTEEVDVEALAVETLKEILTEHDGTVKKPKLSMMILTKLMKHPNREDVRKWVFQGENLSGIDGVTYDEASGDISLD